MVKQVLRNRSLSLISLDKDAKNEIAEALEDVVGVDCDEGPVSEGSGLTPVQIFHRWSNVTLLLQTAA